MTGSNDTASSRPARSLWTPANVVTCVRVGLVPVWLVTAELARSSADPMLAWLAFVLYVLVSLTDKLDGYLARSRDEVTTFGKFLDPIADKLAVIAALLFLMEVFPTIVSSWIVFVIVARELLVDGLRMVASSRGSVIAAGTLGKWKTAVTMVAFCTLLFAYALSASGIAGTSSDACRTAGAVLTLVSVALTVWSGVDYFAKGWPLIGDGD